jgi:hypothetical protein
MDLEDIYTIMCYVTIYFYQSEKSLSLLQETTRRDNKWSKTETTDIVLNIFRCDVHLMQ